MMAYRSRGLRLRPTPLPSKKSPTKIWAKPKAWIVAVLGAGVSAAVVPWITSLVDSGGHALGRAVGVVSAPPTPISTVPGAPLAVSVRWKDECHGWTIPKPAIADVPYRAMSGNTDPNLDDAWARAMGGADAAYTGVEVTIQGASGAAVVLTDLRVKVLSRGPALTGVQLGRGAGCGTGIEPRTYNMNLFDASPELTTFSNGSVVKASEQPYKISQTDPEVFYLLGALNNKQNKSFSITFEYELDWTQGSTSGTYTITAPDGKPFFATTSDAKVYYFSNGDGWGSEPAFNN